MWAIFQLQDFMGIDESIRRSDPKEERINVPANPKHYWRYRMHLSLEQLLMEEKFNQEWFQLIQSSGRV
jgi:4-alpha-glucanotransferase